MSVSHAYRYAESSVVDTSASPRLVLATSGGPALHPHFFEGRVKSPRLIAELLTAVHIVVGSRFFTPPSMLARILALADPIVTSGGGVLRFEGFSSCCSTYIRVDLLPDGYDGAVAGHGTTNVDFNAPMRAALARVRDQDGLALAVGRHEFAVRSAGSETVERKVDLPERWIRGLLEVQSYLASMQLRFEVNHVEALRFLRALPRSSTARTPLWAGNRGAGMYSSAQPDADGVRVTDAGRLRVLEALAPRARSMTVYSDEAQQSSAWVLHFAGARLTLALSAEVWRGFSGEGQALRALLHADVALEALLPLMRGKLSWQPTIDSQALAAQLGCTPAAVRDGLRILGVSGLVGFDVSSGSYFHRVLPLDLSIVEDMHPRLRGARDLIEQRAVSLQSAAPIVANVRSGGADHTVREVDGALRCTCPWYAKYRGERGPCKHVLAVEVATVTGR